MFILVIQWLFQRLYTWREEGKERENSKGLVFVKHIIYEVDSLKYEYLSKRNSLLGKGKGMNQNTDSHVQTYLGHYEKNNLKGGVISQGRVR